MPDHFSERDAADLLRRAALLQAQHEHLSGSGLSLDEVKHAAEAAGIHPAFVEQAALGAGGEEPEVGRAFGIQTGARRTRIVPGHVSDNEWGKMVATLRRQLGGSGEVETIGEVRRWSRSPITIQAEPQGENTRISASASWSGEARFIPILAILCLLTALFVTGIGIATSDMGAFAFAAMMAAYAALCAWASWGRLGPKGARMEATFDRTLDALAVLASSDERARPDRQPDRLAPTLLDPGLLGEEPLPDLAPPARQRTRS